MAIGPPPPLSPPQNAAPLDPDGQHSQSWAQYHQRVADLVSYIQNTMHTGVVDGSDAAAGEVGEYLAATGPGVGLASNTVTNVATLTLTAGDWNVEGNIVFNPTGVVTFVSASINTVSGAMGAFATANAGTLGTGLQHRIGSGGTARVNVTATTTAYLVGQCFFTSGTMNAVGRIWARRVR